jgi:hypothetical protein
VLAFKTGKSTLFVYRSPYAGTNKATVVTFVAEEVDDLVRTLKDRGVAFEHYDLPQMTPTRRCSRGRTHEGRLVQGSGRQYFQPGHAPEHRREKSRDRLSPVDDLTSSKSRPLNTHPGSQ